MAPNEALKTRRMTVSGEVAEGPTHFYGLIMRTTQTYETLTVYLSPDDNDMYLFGIFVNSSKGSTPFLFPYPVYSDNGLYIKMGGAIVDVLVFLEDLPR